ncbi:YncE family protein [Desulfitobacterium sp. THU1]|uniref:YncE family protein n=1 Tax=Desulfitobacterium sp. THU1 TaxID=3138072 RepID=UPI00311EFB49
MRIRGLVIGTIIVMLAIFLAGCGQAASSAKDQATLSQTPAGQTGVNQTPAQQTALPPEALFVAQFTTNQIAVIHLGTGDIVEKIPVGAKPLAIIKSPDQTKVYVANSGSGDVYQINTSTGEIEAKISMGNQPVAMTINAAGDTLYVLDYYLNRVSIIDLRLRSMVGYIPLNTFGFEERIEPPDCCTDIFGDPLGAGRKPSALVLDEAHGKIYVGNMGTWDIAVIDLQSEKEVQAFDATFGINDLFLDSSAGNLYISAAGNEEEVNDSILKLSLKGGEKIDKLQIGKKPVGMALSPDGQIIHVITQASDGAKLISLRAADGEIIGQCSLAGEPGDIALSEDGQRAYITNLLDGTVLVIDTTDYTVIKIIETGVTPKSLVYILNDE